MSQSFHASQATQAGSPDPLGLLADLPGRWVGTGFNVIARPNLQNNLPFFLELNATTETLEFTNLGGEATNRGSLQNDINLFGVHYLQQISDAALGKVHVEPGLWMRVPPTTVPEVTADTYVRQAVVPHGDAVLAQSTVVVPATANGMPQIDPLDSTPFTGAIPALHASPAAPVTDRDFLSQYTTTPLPPGLPAGLDDLDTIRNPALVLAAQIAGQIAAGSIKKTIFIQISSVLPDSPNNIVNIPFITKNANAVQMDANLWIETVNRPDGNGSFLQLQYAQRVILDFPSAPGGQIIRWPHISVATLIKQ